MTLCFLDRHSIISTLCTKDDILIFQFKRHVLQERKSKNDSFLIFCNYFFGDKLSGTDMPDVWLLISSFRVHSLTMNLYKRAKVYKVFSYCSDFSAFIFIRLMIKTTAKSLMSETWRIF